MVQGVCMVLEDVVMLGKVLECCDGDVQQVFVLYELVCIFCMVCIVWFICEMGCFYYVVGVECQVCNLLWKGKLQEVFYCGIEWLYGWKEDNCFELC